jgi:hypothetical protein
MNINISIKTLVLFLLVFTIDTYKAQTSNDSLQIIVGSKITSQKQIAIMENHIKEMVSVRYVSYCSNINCLCCMQIKNIMAVSLIFLMLW